MADTRAGEDASLKSRDVAALDTRQRKQDISQYGADEMAPLRTRQEPPASPELAVNTSGRVPEAGTEATLKSAVREQEEPIAKPETADGRARLRDRWQRQMDDVGFDLQGVMNEAREREKSRPDAGEVQDAPVQAMEAVRTAISVLSDNKTRFTYGDILLTAHNAGELQNSIPDLRRALDQAIHDNLLVPLDGDKGVFTSHIHLLDELSVQSLAADILKENRVVSFSLTGSPVPGHLEHVARAPAVIISAPASVGRLRAVTEELVTMSREQGREVSVLTSSAERALSFAKSPALKDRLSTSRPAPSRWPPLREYGSAGRGYAKCRA
ncbi:hypothetical protein C1Y42_22950 [Pantoea sp. ICBG 985]|uniref:hypothetical protein n=1 Tax=Pantoea sp. ICBG 985 TaxID=2071683 RepID=UPI000CE50771|nr:hypothetical protein [Pantoea sp. ICBG 985]PPC67015.1 hypothetical protein C1Y42_22950 [Pantoea sp. ICBG 985]